MVMIGDKVPMYGNEEGEIIQECIHCRTNAKGEKNNMIGVCQNDRNENGSLRSCDVCQEHHRIMNNHYFHTRNVECKHCDGAGIVRYCRDGVIRKVRRQA